MLILRRPVGKGKIKKTIMIMKWRKCLQLGCPVLQHNVCEAWKRQDEVKSQHGDNGGRKDRRRD